MQHFLIICLATFAAVLAAVLVSWPLHGWLHLDAVIEFHRFAKTLIILLIIAAALATLKRRGLPVLQTCGFTPAPHGTTPKRMFLAGLAGGVVILLPLAALFHLLDLRVFSGLPGWQTSLYMVVKYFFTGLLIAVIEESFFRGILMDGFIKKRRLVSAVLLPAAFFALLHFIAIKETASGSQVPWYYGLQALFEGIGEKHTLGGFVEAAAALFVAGVFLSLVRLSTNHVAPCIGIHCGWVAAVKIDKKLTGLNTDSDFAFLIGDYDRFIGWGTFAWFSVLTLWWILRIRRNPDGAGVQH